MVVWAVAETTLMIRTSSATSTNATANKPAGSFRESTEGLRAACSDPVVTTAVRLEVEPQTVSHKAGEIGPPVAMFIDEDVEWRELGVIEWQVESRRYLRRGSPP
jgi:hypothetical protein